MSGAARLLSVRLQGFKSFAERTHVEFGPGISAIVGPNGSGKSNLADALRWALGEQGRALRSRKAEDVIWAGSERRPALGMADVQLVVDNADGLLPVEYGVVELGRRLYRSGENDYLLNRQRVRLRDLVDLLDGAHLADNAFLFIGQGMVDQALALRPEERRPLFEEVAGVRRHERRRRRAEEQLAESEANLARVDDVLGELRPQARRLAAQAEQQASRRSAGDELAEAILATAHGRWHAASAQEATASAAVTATRIALDAAMSTLADHETAVGALAETLAGRGVAEAERRAVLEAARERATELRVEAGRVRSEIAGAERDRRRIAEERPAIDAEIAAAGGVLAEPTPARDLALEDEVGRAEAALADATGEMGRAALHGVDSEDEAVIRRLEAVHRADVDAARRRLAEAERVAGVERARAAAAEATRVEAEAGRSAAGRTLEAAAAALAAATGARHAAETEVNAAEADARSRTAAAATARAAATAAEGRVAAAEEALRADDHDSFATAAVARGGRRLDTDVVVEPDLRLAVRAALAGVSGAVVLPRREVAGLVRERGAAIVEEAAARAAAPDAASRARETTFVDRLERAGGGLLAGAIRRDDRGTVARLLAHVGWLPDLVTCLDLQAELPEGWLLVPRDGRAVVGEVVVSLGVGDPVHDARAEVERLRTFVREAAAAAAGADQAAMAAIEGVTAASAGADVARAAEAAAAGAQRRAEDQARSAAGAAESATREAAWLAAQAARFVAEVERLQAAVHDLGAVTETDAPVPKPAAAEPEAARETASKARIAALRATRDRLAVLLVEAEAKREAASRRHAAAEAAAAMGRSRLASLDAAGVELAERDARLDRERAAVDRERAIADVAVADARAALDALLQRDAEDRRQLESAEQAAGAAREALAAAQARQQAADHDALEARFGLEAVREQVLVELAGLGRIGLRHLGAADEPGVDAASGGDAGPEADAGDDRLTGLLDGVAPTWARTPPPEAPGPGRLAALRRRFHELGAGNPFAVEEYAEVKTRLDALETQRTDLQAAIERTRSLIVELDALIASQFRTTFEALERAFERRFRELFGGGYAKLTLTDPADLTATGVEIIARPPGKKPQPLAMLSGGERALTAVALLFAMLEVRPVPFCVLDEVDAALDEANIGRFTAALRELATQTQCIVITHNRGTIETADALYGVTVGEDSVSRVISLRLEDATELAGEATAGEATAPAARAGETAQAQSQAVG